LICDGSLSEGIDGEAGAASNFRASVGLTTTATPFAGWVLASGGIVISLLLTAQAESSASAAMMKTVRINATGFSPLFLSLPSAPALLDRMSSERCKQEKFRAASMPSIA
jgi:hypothetical protein